MSEKNPKVGDIVVLKSGGPDMTVSSQLTKDVVRCHWFDNNHELKEGDFDNKELNVID